MLELKGQISRITYYNDQNGFCVARVDVDGRHDSVPVVGKILSPNPGDVLHLQGEWKNHPKFGRQFEVSAYSPEVPVTAIGIEKYLASGKIHGIGPSMARRIVQAFGEKTMDVIENRPQKLTDVDGIGKKRAESIQKAWREQSEIKEILMFLQENGVSSAYAAKIYRVYGGGAIKVLQDEPYRLAFDIHGIGFRVADKIAGEVGIDRESTARMHAGLIFILHTYAEKSGHVYYPYEDLVEACVQELGVQRGIVMRGFREATANEDIVIEETDGDKAVYLDRMYRAETGTAKSLRRLKNAPDRLGGFNRSTALARVQDKQGITLADKQIEAIRSALDNKVSIITGGPGTGKTTIINSFMDIMGEIGAKAVLAAPTGRAAKRMGEATGREAKTIHRLLEFDPANHTFKRNMNSPLKCDAVVVDEVSMVDIPLMASLLKAIPDHATVVLVGDVNQLPSVGAGDVLRDMIGSGRVSCVKLDKIFRQASQSGIVVNAHRVNSGKMPDTANEADDFAFFEREEPEEARAEIVDLVSRRIPDRFGFDPVRDIQILCPMTKGAVGTQTLNGDLQEIITGGKGGIGRGGQVFSPGDKIMQIRNNYEKDVFNGDIGWVVDVDTEEQELKAEFDGRYVVYESADMDEIVLAYATTVHKSQGSEYPVVVIPVMTQHYIMLARNLIYTGITRGKQMVVLVGMKKALGMAVRNNKQARRYTRLASRL